MNKQVQEQRQELHNKLIASGLADEIGGVIYSGDSTITKGKYLFFGLNPGGEGGHSIKEDFERKHVDRKNPEYNHMLDSEFGNYEKGEAPYQKRFCRLFEGLYQEPRNVCATNLIFIQSKDKNHLANMGKGKIKDIANAFWPFHQTLIEIVDPDTLFVVDLCGLNYLGGKMIRIQHSDRHPAWRCHSVIGEMHGRKRQIFWVPHFTGDWESRARGSHPVEKHSPEIFDWIKDREKMIIQ